MTSRSIPNDHTNIVAHINFMLNNPLLRQTANERVAELSSDKPKINDTLAPVVRIGDMAWIMSKMNIGRGNFANTRLAIPCDSTSTAEALIAQGGVIAIKSFADKQEFEKYRHGLKIFHRYYRQLYPESLRNKSFDELCVTHPKKGGEGCYFPMPLFPGSLHQFQQQFSNKENFHPIEVLRAIKACLKELQRFHRETGHIHSDLTLENIQYDYINAIARFVDFDSASPIGDPSQLSYREVPQGTNHIVPPEFFEKKWGQFSYHQSSDYYAIAATIFRLLGASPWEVFQDKVLCLSNKLMSQRAYCPQTEHLAKHFQAHEISAMLQSTLALCDNDWQKRPKDLGSTITLFESLLQIKQLQVIINKIENNQTISNKDLQILIGADEKQACLLIDSYDSLSPKNQDDIYSYCRFKRAIHASNLRSASPEAEFIGSTTILRQLAEQLLIGLSALLKEMPTGLPSNIAAAGQFPADASKKEQESAPKGMYIQDQDTENGRRYQDNAPKGVYIQDQATDNSKKYQDNAPKGVYIQNQSTDNSLQHRRFCC